MSHQEEAAVAAEKLRLIREGELYRIKVVHAKALVTQALQPDALMHGAVEHAVGMAQARLGGLLQPGGLSGLNFRSLKSLMPYALTVGSFIARKRLIKPALALAVVAGAGVAWLLRHKRTQE
ncbi:hypothetical protein SAMN05192549_107110 [Duganella sacchari]|uniref:Uncharacterized protein n=1 Tax=Duganella sacchari TaxID=551987 RepID=A0A1M7QIW3_9BURK|nr:hypothetical protein [Duganella sacchari]SHN30895.1 hypothetical protein SAMN05192549_107110 [Duganella sacchari]